MSTPSDPRHELASTYAVSDRANREEMERLQLQDRLLTLSMGGVLPEQPDPGRFERVLDVGCGTGGWLIETASTYPGISQLTGIDISEKMLAYARSGGGPPGRSPRAVSHHGCPARSRLPRWPLRPD